MNNKSRKDKKEEHFAGGEWPRGHARIKKIDWIKAKKQIDGLPVPKFFVCKECGHVEIVNDILERVEKKGYGKGYRAGRKWDSWNGYGGEEMWKQIAEHDKTRQL